MQLAFTPSTLVNKNYFTQQKDQNSNILLKDILKAVYIVAYLSYTVIVEVEILMRSDNVQDSTTPSSRHLFSRHAPILLFVLSFVWPLPYYIVWKLEKMNKHVHRSHSTDSSGRVFSCGTESLNALLERHRAAWVAFDVQGCSNHCNLSTAAFRILGKNNYYILRKKKKKL